MIRERSALPATAWPTRPVRSILASREEYGGDGPLLSLSAQHGVRYRDLSEGRAASDDLSNYRVVRPGDLVINRLSARDGAYAVSSLTGLVSPAYWVLRPSQNIDPRWVDYVLRSSPYRAEIGRISKFMPPAQFDLPWPLFRNLPIPAPPPSEQRAIADFLDRETAQIDAMVDAQERLVALLEERRRAAIQRGATIGLGDAPLIDTGYAELGRVPSDWVPMRLKRVVTTAAGGTPDTDDRKLWAEEGERGTPWVAIGDMSRRASVVQTSKSVTDAGLASKRLTVGPPGTLLFAMYASVGEVSVLEIPACWNQALLGLTPRPGVATTKFLYYALQTVRDRLPTLYRSNTQHNINAEQVGNLLIAVPPLGVQEEVVRYLDEVTARTDAMISKAQESISLMKERRAAVISAAVTGRIDVRTGIEHVERDLEEARA